MDLDVGLLQLRRLDFRTLPAELELDGNPFGDKKKEFLEKGMNRSSLPAAPLASLNFESSDEAMSSFHQFPSSAPGGEWVSTG